MRCVSVYSQRQARRTNSVGLSVGLLQLVTAVQLDRESKSSHVVHISCHDNGSPAMTSHSTLSVVISDVNDNKPTFSQDLYTGRH